MAGFLSLCSARFASPVKLAGSAPAQDGGRADAFFGSDADYAANGAPQRRRAEFHWLGAWREEAGIDRFLASPASYLPPLQDAEFTCGLKLVPYLKRGADVLPVDAHPLRPGPDAPIAIVTSIGTYASEAEVVAAGQAASFSRRSLEAADGMLQELLLIPFPPATLELFTVTAWRNEAAARDWAYRTDAHRGAMAFYKSASEQPRVSFTRCLIAGSFGDWQAWNRGAWPRTVTARR
jgi:hypothetical protein